MFYIEKNFSEKFINYDNDQQHLDVLINIKQGLLKKNYHNSKDYMN